MYKLRLPVALLMSLILGSLLLVATTASAQNYGIPKRLYYGSGNSSYGDDNSYYSKYPTDDKRYECRTGTFEGFFVGSVEFYNLKHNKFDDRNVCSY